MHTEDNRAPRQAQPSFLDAKNARPNADGSPNILRFGAGLMLYVAPRGKVWKRKVFRDGKGTLLTLGQFSAEKTHGPGFLTLKEAEAENARLRTAVDPAAARREAKVEAARAEAATFAAVVERWLRAEGVRREWSEDRERSVTAQLANHVLPVWGDRPIASIQPYEATDLILALHRRHKATAVAIKQYVVDVFDFAVEERHLEANPVMRRRLPRQARGTPRPAVGSIEEARRVLAIVEKLAPSRRIAQPHSRLSVWTLLAHRLVALTAARVNEVCGARWSEFDLDAAVWVIPAERMKAGREHVVALAPQAVEVLRVAETLRVGEFVFPNQRGRNRPMHRTSCQEALAKLLAREGLDGAQVMHGWRSAFSTIMNERDPSRAPVVEAMLAHKVGDLEGRYNRAQHLSARAPIACAWADLLLDGAPSAFVLAGLVEVETTNVIPLRRIA